MQASILYSTVGHRGSYKHWRAKRIPDKVATTLLQCSCCRPWPNKTSPCSLALLMHERVEPSQAEPCSSAPQSKSPDEPSCEWSLCEAPQTIRGPSECHCLQNLLTPRHIQSESIQSTVRVHSEYIQSIWIYSTSAYNQFQEILIKLIKFFETGYTQSAVNYILWMYSECTLTVFWLCVWSQAVASLAWVTELRPESRYPTVPDLPRDIYIWFCR